MRQCSIIKKYLKNLSNASVEDVSPEVIKDIEIKPCHNLILLLMFMFLVK